MRANDPNLPDLRRIAQALGELREQLVFVGGAVAGLLVTDPLADPVRATRDVDAVVNASRAVFHRIEAQVAARGFARDASSDVICRWVHKASGVLFDLMPVQPEVLGFSNRWYPYAVQTAVPVDLGEGVTIRLVSAVGFVATKLEAFASRGGGDFVTSHDLEDVLNIVDGREELAAELAGAPADLRQAVATAFAALIANRDFENVLPGLIAEPERAGLVMGRLRDLSH
ncbi:MAG TPA: nucleotidyl transferase AbiEii/AbiGii toxin family protein [Ideonella sp.]|uniref:nucleotidyl transferase AbiEii/AbiGii toxin family protein n=1 Tax=Ideonella sp. TaxID=1929293 RepID=UPI002B9432F0|nr:nucleotidyl transferase AbiEii/AbiGii toxin family protein [Ideonella sp.]HSI47844.1 nucleotidyl transferase AbiEii/AbiGii toxin family protein [Ideonella sp.]